MAQSSTLEDSTFFSCATVGQLEKEEVGIQL